MFGPRHRPGAMRWLGIAAVGLGVSGIRPAAGAASAPDLLALVRAYADAMIAHGRDVYGGEHSPLFAAALDRSTMRLGSRESFGAIPGVREGDRSLGGANPQDDAALYEILYELTRLTGEPNYAAEADRTLAFFFNRCQSPETGLMAWGEHLSWDFHRETCAGNDLHEVNGEWPFWDACYRLAPDACWRFAIGQWDHQIADRATGDFSRHARWSKHGPDGGFEFPRYAGQMILNWADAYARAENAGRPRRDELPAAIAVLLRRMEQNARRTKTGLLPAGSSPKGSHDEVVWISHLIEYVRCLWDAAPRVDAPLAERMRRMALEQDAVILAAPHRIADGGGFAVTLDASTGEPRTRSTNRPYTDTWDAGYGQRTHAGIANMCHARYRQLETGHPGLAARYRAMILAAAEQYLSALPPPDALHKPDAFALVIELLLHARDLTGNPRFLDRAGHFGRTAIGLFLDDDRPLPKATSRHTHYEAITGGPALMLALLRLHCATR